MTDIGRHLLGRKPSPPDDRDYDLAHFSTPSDLDRVLLEVLSSKQVAQATKDAFAIVIPAIKALQPIAPTPTPPNPTDVVNWLDVDNPLDQGDTPHCVGFGWAQWGNTDPIEDHFVNADGDAIYYECKVIDGEPNMEDGSDVRSGAKAMKARKRLSVYAFANTVDDAIAFIKKSGPVVFGTDWTDDMFTPDNEGRIHPTGAVAGGHCYIGFGYDPTKDDLLFLNSWGSSWSKNGRFRMSVTEFKRLFANYGEGCVSVELA
jgi:hypothetical protein